MISWLILTVLLLTGYLFWRYVMAVRFLHVRAWRVGDVVSEEFRLASQPPRPGRLRLVGLYLAMVAGMAAVAVFHQLKRSGAAISKEVVVQFALALIVSPIVFRNMLPVDITSRPDYVLYSYAFQNGFFWEAIFNGFIGG